MAYRFKRRGLGDLPAAGAGGAQLAAQLYSGSSLPSPSSPSSFDFLATLNDAVQGSKNALYNAFTGNLTTDQVNTIRASGAASIAAAGGTSQDVAAWQSQLNNVVTAGYYGGLGNILADLGLDPGAPAGQGSTGVLGWLSANWEWVFAGAAVFLVFRPDKAF
jgi:hypothetical protein